MVGHLGLHNGRSILILGLVAGLLAGGCDADRSQRLPCDPAVETCDPPDPHAELELHPFELQVVGETGDIPAESLMRLSNSGDLDVDWKVETSHEWLEVSPARGRSSARLQDLAVRVHTAGLSPDGSPYRAEVYVYEDGGLEPVDTSIVEVTIEQQADPEIELANPLIAVEPAALSFTFAARDAFPDSLKLEIANIGDGRLDWTAVSTVDWLWLSPTSGMATADGGDHFAVTVVTQELNASSAHYTTDIIIYGSGASNSPQIIPVTVTVTITQD